MAIRSVVTMGYGNGTFSGTVGLVVRLGYAQNPPAVSSLLVAKFPAKTNVATFPSKTNVAKFKHNTNVATFQ